VYPLSRPYQILVAAVESLADSSDNILEPEVFDVFRSFLRHRQALSGPVMNKILDSISSGFGSQVEATLRDVETEDHHTTMVHKTPLEMYAFLLHWFVNVADNVKPPDDDEIVPLAAPAKARRGRGGKAATGKASSSHAQANKHPEHWTWIEQIPQTLALICKALRLKTQRIWTASTDRDTFIK
jgi:condensin complex subunit 1